MYAFDDQVPVFGMLGAKSFPSLRGLSMSEAEKKAVGLVVVIRQYSYEIGTGTLVSPHTVLTAAHVVHDAALGLGYAYFVPVIGLTRAEASDIRTLASVAGIKARNVFLHPAYNDTGRAGTPSELLDKVSNDLAIMCLNSEVLGAVPMPFASDSPLIGAQVQLVGYGRVVASEGSETLATSRLVDLPPSKGWDEGTVTIKRDNKIVSRLPAKLGSGGTIYGDSGGPLIVAGSGGRPNLAGVTVHIYNYPATDLPAAQWTDAERVDYYRTWIDSQVAISENYWTTGQERFKNVGAGGELNVPWYRKPQAYVLGGAVLLGLTIGSIAVSRSRRRR